MPETIELASQIQQLDGDWTVVNKDWAAPPVQPQSSPPFVGRGNEINRLTQLLALSAAGQGQLALISGEPGIGKSRLVEETAIVARQQGCQLLIAHCYQVEQSMPYQPLIDLLSQVMARDASWQRLDPIWLRELVVLVPEMGAAAAASTAAANLADEPDENRQVRLVQAFSHFFAGQADRQKLLLIIEDLHWADAATLQCLHYFARHIDQTPIMLIFTFRADSLSTDADLASTLHSLQRISHATFLSLARLVETDTTALLAQTTDTARFADRLGHWLYKETAGNPFFLISMLQSIREEGLLDAADETDWQTLSQTDPDLLLPQSIRESVLERLRRLSQFDRDCLEWMAVYGRPLTFSTLHDISQQSQMTLLNSLENLVVRQLLFELAGQYDFNHEKIREVVYSDLGAARRGLYHQSIADVLESSVRLSASPEMAANLAYHFERGGNSEKSLTYWMQAGNYALDAYAYSQAARHFERALALSDQPAARMDAYLGLGRSVILQDDHAAAAAIIGQGLSLAERYKDDSRRAKLMYVQAQNASREHRPDGGKPEVEAALEAAEQAGDDYHLAQNLLLLTEVHESRGDLSSAFETASRAQLVSKRLDDYQLQARTLLEIGFQRALRADFDQSANAARKGLKLLTESDDLESIAYAWNILGRALGGRGDYGPALDAFDHSLDAAQKSGDRYLIAQVFNMRGWLHRELGDYDNALAFDEEGVEYARRWNKPSPEISARLNVCLDLLHLGDPKRALRLLEGIDNQVTAGNFGFHSWRWRLRLLYGRGLCCLTLNQPQEVLELAEEGLQKAEQDGIHKYAALNYELKGLALSELGEMAEAVSSLGTAVDLADNIHCQPVRRASRHKLAALYRQTGFEQEAENASAEAARITQEIAATIDDDVLRDTFLRAALPR
jgi:tetratricopeptide (TPR) repeat protein